MMLSAACTMVGQESQTQQQCQHDHRSAFHAPPYQLMFLTQSSTQFEVRLFKRETILTRWK